MISAFILNIDVNLFGIKRAQSSLVIFRYSMMQDKRVFWQYEIEGQRDITREVEKMILETADEYKQQADATNKAVRTVIHITHHVE